MILCHDRLSEALAQIVALYGEKAIGRSNAFNLTLALYVQGWICSEYREFDARRAAINRGDVSLCCVHEDNAVSTIACASFAMLRRCCSPRKLST